MRIGDALSRTSRACYTAGAVAARRDVFGPYLALDRRIWLVAATRCINTMGFSLVMPFMSLYLVKEQHVLAKTSGLIYLVAGIAAALAQGTAGELADRIGRRRLMSAALALRAGHMILLGLAVNAHVSVHVLGALIVVNGILRALFEPAAAAAVTDLAPEGERVTAFALSRMGVNLGWSLGPMIGGGLTHIGYGTLFFVAAPVLLAAAVVAHRIADAPRGRAPTRSEGIGAGALVQALRQNPPFAMCLGLVFLGSTMTVQFFATLSTYMGAELGHSPGTIGLVYTVNGLLVLAFQLPAVALIRRGGARVALVFGPTLYVIAYFMFGLSPSFAWLALCAAVLTAGEVVFSPALSDMAAFLGDPARQGRNFGLFGLMQTLGVSLGPLVGGAVFDALRHRHVLMWWCFALGMAIVGIGYAWFTRRYAPRVT
jgi:MFS family permease